MVASSVVLTVVVLNYHHRTADIHTMPPWVNNFFPTPDKWDIDMITFSANVQIQTSVNISLILI